jgi:hypothetical protein
MDKWQKCLQVTPIPETAQSIRRGSVAARLLGLRVKIPPGSRLTVSCECFVLFGRDFGVGLITRPDCGVFKCNREASMVREFWPIRDCCAIGEKYTENPI